METNEPDGSYPLDPERLDRLRAMIDVVGLRQALDEMSTLDQMRLCVAELLDQGDFRTAARLLRDIRRAEDRPERPKRPCPPPCAGR